MADTQSTVTLVAPDGRLYDFPRDTAPAALAKGFRQQTETEERHAFNETEYGGAGGTALAGLAGAARGLSFGLSDQALTKLGVADQDVLKGLKEANPIASTVGDVGGIVGGTILSGGAGVIGEGAQAATAGVRAVSALGKGAGALAESALGNLAERGLAGAVAAKGLAGLAGGAAEGAAYGAGQLISEEALGDTNINAQSLLAHVGLGALLGGVAGGVLGAGGELAGAGLKKATEAVKERFGLTSVKDFLDDLAGGQALRTTLGQQKRAFDQLEEKGLAEKAKKYLVNDIGVDLGDTTESMAEKLSARTNDLGTKLHDTVAALDAATEGKPLERLSPRLVAKRVQEEVAEPLKKLAANQDEYKAVMREVKNIRALGNKGMSFADAAAQRRAIQDKINYDVRNGLTVAAGAKNKISQIWNDVIDETAAPILEKTGDAAAYRSLREEFSLAKRLSDYAENRAQGNQSNQVLGLTDKIIGSAAGASRFASAGGGPASAALGVGAAFVSREARRRAPAIISNLANRAAKLGMLQKSTEAITSSIDAAVDKIASGAATMTGSAAPATVKVLLGTSFAPEAAARKVADRKDAAKARSEELSQLMGNPQRLADRVALAVGGFESEAPKIAGQAALAVTRAVQFLHDKAPKRPVSANSLQPLLNDWKPSDQEVARFERYVRATLHPLSVIDDAKNGTLTKEGVEVLRELYPDLYKMTTEKLAAKLAESKRKLPYADRISLSLLFGVPADDTMSPDFISRAQAMWQKKPSQGQGGGGQRVAGLDSLDLGQTLRTETQKLEAKQ